MEACFITQQPFVIDNTNPTIEERRKYIELAIKHKYKVIGYYFQSKLEESNERNGQRQGKENIPEIGIRGTYHKLELPSYKEGFDQLYYVEIQNNGFIIKEWKNEIR